MIAEATRTYRAGEYHEFEGYGRRFLYLVPAGAIFEVGEFAAIIIDRLAKGEASHEELIGELTANGMAFGDAEDLLGELLGSRALLAAGFQPEPVQEAPAVFPMQTLVMNLTNQCNLSCQYCYEFGADKVATPNGKPKFMDLETAKASVDFLMDQSAGRRTVHITFFGGETLMNFPLLKQVVD